MKIIKFFLIFLLTNVHFSSFADDKDFNIGIDIVTTACYKPYEQILKNAGLVKIPDLGQEKEWTGFDIKQNKMVDFKKSGIIDPFKVTRSALQNAASIAGTILLTEATIVDKPKETNTPEIDPAAMMGGMM